MDYLPLLIVAAMSLGCDRTASSSSSAPRPIVDTGARATASSVSARPEASGTRAPPQAEPSKGSGKFVRERPFGDDVKGVDACAYIGGMGFACLDALLAETDPIKKRYMRRLSDADAHDSIASEKKGEPGGVPHAEFALNCVESAACGKKSKEGNPEDDGYFCLTKAEIGRTEKDAAKMRKAHAFACKCGGDRASIPVMGGYLACDGTKPVERGHELSDEEATEIRDCATCDPDKGPIACEREIARLKQTDADVASYLQNTHVPRCQAK